jgi:hypothetical protein
LARDCGPDDGNGKSVTIPVEPNAKQRSAPRVPSLDRARPALADGKGADDPHPSFINGYVAYEFPRQVVFCNPDRLLRADSGCSLVNGSDRPKADLTRRRSPSGELRD